MATSSVAAAAGSSAARVGGTPRCVLTTTGCPSGCRLQGLMSRVENEMERKLWRICERAKMYEDDAEKSMTAMTLIHNFNRKVLVSRHASELKMVEHAEGVARNLTLLRKHSAGLARRLEELHLQALQQVQELQRTEVDVDMKLRSCRGSCRRTQPFTFDLSTYQILETELDQRRRSRTPPRDLPHISLIPARTSQLPTTDYKAMPTVQRELLAQFEDVGQNRIVLEERDEGVEQVLE